MMFRPRLSLGWLQHRIDDAQSGWPLAARTFVRKKAKPFAHFEASSNR
jgi:hypothetical protein